MQPESPSSYLHISNPSFSEMNTSLRYVKLFKVFSHNAVLQDLLSKERGMGAHNNNVCYTGIDYTVNIIIESC